MLEKIGKQSDIFASTKRALKIALITPQLPPGGNSGIGVATLHLALGLCKLGCEVDVFTWLDDPSKPVTSHAGLKIIRIPNFREVNYLENQLGRIAGITSRILTLGQRYSFNGSIRNIRGALTMLFSGMDKKLSDYDIAETCEWGGVGSIFTRTKGDVIKVTKLHASLYSHAHTYLPFHRFSKLDVRIASSIERSGINASNLVLSPSNSNAKEAREWLPISNKIDVLHNSIDLEYVDDLLKKNQVRRPERCTSILFVGRVDELKGAQILNDVAGLLRSGARKWVLNIVGTENATAKSGNLLPGQNGNLMVNWLGEQQNEFVYKFLSLSDLLLFPTYTDNCPMAVLEAMAAGIPVVASKVGGIPEIITSGMDGILCPRDDSNAFYEAIISLSDPLYREKLGKCAKAKITEHYASTIVAGQWLDICRDSSKNNPIGNMDSISQVNPESRISP